MSKSAWYKEGLKFTCHGCGGCCTGDAGFVWINEQEIADLSKSLGYKNIELFEKKFIRKVGDRKSLIEHSNGDCVFFDNKRRACTVYEYRPKQCKTWPFWESNLKSPKSWSETCAVCPGSGKGELHSFEDIESQKMDTNK